MASMRIDRSVGRLVANTTETIPNATQKSFKRFAKEDFLAAAQTPVFVQLLGAFHTEWLTSVGETLAALLTEKSLFVVWHTLALRQAMY